ncbi:MAG: adenine methylase [Desulfovibrionales bacterium]|nr:adenine methylase [Desulfovibrionales bacterium]
MPTKTALSPLRYPGGKGSLFKFIAEIILRNDRFGGSYYEPFAGGAGCALRLLGQGVVGEIVLNDADPSIFSFWTAVINETDRFIEKIYATPLSMNSWTTQREIWTTNSDRASFDVGFATFFLNRCNRSGIINKAGPIGGAKQSGKWKLDARFNHKTLEDRIRFIGLNKERIKIFNIDALDFMKIHFSSRKNRSKFVYLDPPYYRSGNRLYFNTFDDKKHFDLAQYIQKQVKLKWLVTYDDNNFIRGLYSKLRSYHYSLSYSLQKKKKAKELIVVPDNMDMPREFIFNSKKVTSGLTATRNSEYDPSRY